MKEIIETIHNPDMLESRSDAYRHLSQEEKYALLYALKAIKDESAGSFLNAILPDEDDKNLQKLIKKLLFRLKTVGVRIDEPRLAGEPVLRKIEEKRSHKAFISNFDFDNLRVVVTAFEVKKNNFIFVNAFTRFSEGLTDLKVVPIDLRQLDTILHEYRKGSSESVFFVEVPYSYATCLIEEGDTRFHRYTDEISHLKQFALTASAKDVIHSPEDIYGLNAPDGIPPLPVDTVLSNDIFAPFTLSWETLETDRNKFAGLGTSSILLPPYMIEEKRKEFLKNLLEKEPLQSQAHAVKRMLEDYAYIFYLSRLFDCFNGIMALLNQADGPYQAFSFFARKILEKQEKVEQQPGILINPYEQIRR